MGLKGCSLYLFLLFAVPLSQFHFLLSHSEGREEEKEEGEGEGEGEQKKE